MEGSVNWLKRISLFAALHEDVIRTIAGRTLTRDVPENTILFRKGSPPRGLFIVTAGRIQIYRSSPAGRQVILDNLGPGQPIGEVPLLDGHPYPASARAIEHSKLLFLSRPDFQHLYRTHPQIADAIIGDLGCRLRHMVSLLEMSLLRSVRARAAACILQLAEEAGATHDGDTFTLPRTQGQLAREMATTRESLARALAGLRRDGIIAQHRARVQILDFASLEDAALGEPTPDPPHPPAPRTRTTVRRRL